MKNPIEELEGILVGQLCDVISDRRTEEGLFSGMLHTIREIYQLNGTEDLRISTVLMLEYVYHELMESSPIAQIHKDITRAVIVYHVSRMANGMERLGEESFLEEETQSNFMID